MINRVFGPVIVICLSLVAVSAQAAVVAQYNFAGLSGVTTSVSASTVAPNLLASTIVRGPGLSAASIDNGFNASGWSTGALDVNDYFGFTLTPNAGFTLNVNSIEFNEQRSATGIRDIALRSSLDNFLVNLATVNVPDDTANRRQVFTLSPLFDSITDPITFRIYGFNAEGGGGTFRLGNGTPNNLLVSGSVTAVPEPSSLAMLALCGIGGVIYRRKRNRTTTAPSHIARFC